MSGQSAEGDVRATRAVYEAPREIPVTTPGTASTSDARKRAAEADQHWTRPDPAVRDLIAQAEKRGAVEALRSAAEVVARDAKLPSPDRRGFDYRMGWLDGTKHSENVLDQLARVEHERDLSGPVRQSERGLPAAAESRRGDDRD